MAHTTLPSAHSEADAILAHQVGRRLQLRELHVFWTHPLTEPEEPAAAEEQPAAPSVLNWAFSALGSLLERIGGALPDPRR
jgi:hypothetical protein